VGNKEMTADGTSGGMSGKYGITYFKEANGFRITENPSQSLTDLQ